MSIKNRISTAKVARPKQQKKHENKNKKFRQTAIKTNIRTPNFSFFNVDSLTDSQGSATLYKKFCIIIKPI